MTGKRWKRFGLLATAVGTVLTLVPWASDSLAAASGRPSQAAAAEESFQQCVQTKRSVAALFLIDTSRSLNTTDTRGERVQAIQSSVAALDLLTRTDTTVYIDFLDFGTRTKRSFQNELAEWSDLEGLLPQVQQLVTDFRNRSRSEDTDYIAALEPWADRQNPARPADEIGAIELLERAPSDACQLLVWFTDGKYDIDFQGRNKSLDWLSPPVLVTSKDQGRQLTRDAEQKMCAAGDVVDRLRTPTTGRTVPIYTAVVAFGSNEKDFDLIRSVADGSCGTKPVSGRFFNTQDVTGLVSLLREAVLGTPAKSSREVRTCPADQSVAVENPVCDFSFFVGESLNALSVLAVTGNPSVDASLITPTGQEVKLPREGLTTTVEGAGIEVQGRGDVVRLVEIKLDDRDLSWKGTWRVRFTTSDPSLAERIRNEATIHVFGGIEARLATSTALIRGINNAVRVQIQSTQRSPRSSEGWTAGSSIEVRSGDGEVLKVGAVAQDGTFLVEVPLDREDTRTEVSFTATVVPTFDIGGGRIIALREWQGDLGSLELRDPPNYPLVDFSRTVLSPLGTQSPLSSGTVLVDGTATPDAGGCVSIVSARVTEAPGELLERNLAPEFTWSVNGEPVNVGDECAVRVETGTTAELMVSLAANETQLRVPEGWLKGEIVLRSISDQDAGEEGTFSHVLSVRIVPTVITETDGAFALLLMILAVAIPLLLLYGFNTVSARFDVPEGFFVDVPARYVRGRLVPLTDSGTETQWSNIPDSAFRLVGVNAGLQRQLSLGSVDFRARPSLSPVGEPVASASQPGTLAVGRRGVRRQFAQVGLDLNGAWVFRTDQRSVADAVATNQLDLTTERHGEQLDGSLLAVLPAQVARAREALVLAASEASLQVERTLTQWGGRSAKGVGPRRKATTVAVGVDGGFGESLPNDAVQGDLPGTAPLRLTADEPSRRKFSRLLRRQQTETGSSRDAGSSLDEDLP